MIILRLVRHHQYGHSYPNPEYLTSTLFEHNCPYSVQQAYEQFLLHVDTHLIVAKVCLENKTEKRPISFSVPICP